MLLRASSLLLLLVTSPWLLGQEVKFIDLTGIDQRTILRHPPAPPPKCDEQGKCTPGGIGAAGVGDGAPDIRDPHALAIYLLKVEPTEVNPDEPFVADFRLLNSGLASIEIPVFPHLSDLQPGDEAARFTYFSIALAVRLKPDPTKPQLGNAVGYVQLYGAEDHAGTLLSLTPGEWIRVRARIKMQNWQPDAPTAQFQPEFWLRRNTFTPLPGGGSTMAFNLYPNATRTPYVEVQVVLPAQRKPSHP